MPEVIIPVPTWKEVKPWLWRAVMLAACIYIGYLVREIWLPLGIAFLVALVLDPVVDRLEHRGWSRTAGAALIFASFLIGVVGLAVISVPVMIDQGSAIQRQIDEKLPDRSPGGIDKALRQQHASPLMRSIIKTAVINTEGSVSKSSNWLADRAIALSSNLIWIAIVPIVAFYALRDFHLILAKALLLVKPRRRELVQSAVTEVTAVFAKYMRGLLVVSGLNGLATWGLLELLRVPSAFVLGIAAGILYMVPYIGALVTVALIMAVSFLSGGFNFMLVVLACNIVLHQIFFDQIVTPRVVGGHVGLHPILSIIALLMGNALLGLVGMILAVPVAACIQIGILAMVPKLKAEISLDTHPEATDGQAAHLAEASKTRQVEVDATAELHDSVKTAVENIEAKIPIEEERRAEILQRRKSRAAESDQ